MTWKEVRRHGHCVYIYVYDCVCVFEFNVYKPCMSGLDPIPEENLAWDYYCRLNYDDDDDEFVPPENQNYIYTTPMAESGYDPMDETTEKTPLIPSDDNDDDDTDWNNTDLSQMPAPDDHDSTQPFDPPRAASTPAGEQIPMVTRTRLPQEQQGPASQKPILVGRS